MTDTSESVQSIVDRDSDRGKGTFVLLTVDGVSHQTGFPLTPKCTFLGLITDRRKLPKYLLSTRLTTKRVHWIELRPLTGRVSYGMFTERLSDQRTTSGQSFRSSTLIIIVIGAPLCQGRSPVSYSTFVRG